MNFVERMFALKKEACFKSQSDYDLARIADVAIEKFYNPGELISETEQTLRCVYVVTNGSVESSSGRIISSFFGTASVLLNMPIKSELRAGPEGVRCLLIEKGVFFTIVFQCPSILHELGASDFSEVRSINKEESAL